MGGLGLPDPGRGGGCGGRTLFVCQQTGLMSPGNALAAKRTWSEPAAAERGVRLARGISSKKWFCRASPPPLPTPAPASVAVALVEGGLRAGSEAA